MVKCESTSVCPNVKMKMDVCASNGSSFVKDVGKKVKAWWKWVPLTCLASQGWTGSRELPKAFRNLRIKWIGHSGIESTTLPDRSEIQVQGWPQDSRISQGSGKNQRYLDTASSTSFKTGQKSARLCGNLSSKPLAPTGTKSLNAIFRDVFLSALDIEQ